MRLSRWFLTLIVPPLLVLGAIRLLITDAYLHLEYHKPDFPADPYGFTLEDRLRYGPLTARYLLDGSGPEALRAIRLPDGTPLYNEREIKHLVDVQNVTIPAMYALIGLLIALIGLTAWLRRTESGRAAWRSGLRGGAILTLSLLAALIVYILLDWNHFFDSFHALFFAEGTWRFYYSDSLIRLFPIRFWQDAAITVGALCAAASGLMLFFLRRTPHHTGAS